MRFFAVAVLLFWLQTYVIYKVEFNLGEQGLMQEFLLLLNPVSSAVIFLGLTLFSSGKKLGRRLLIAYFLMTFILYANVVFYRFNSDFITIATMLQTSNFGSLGTSVASLVMWHDILYIIPFAFLVMLYFKSKHQWNPSRIKLKKSVGVVTAGVLIFFVNLGLAEIDRPQLLERTFDRNYLVKYLGAYNFMIYDAIQSFQSSTQRVLADSSDITEVENYTKSKYAEPNPEYFGKGEGKNIIKIHLESFQSFLIDFELHGEEVTPFLNSLVRDEEYTYFDNFFHQTEQGKTADAELTMDTSLYGLPQGSAFVTHGDNTYQSLPAILDQQQGYTSAIFHGDGKSFWNRDEVYRYLGIHDFYYDIFYDMSEENVINYGLKDKPFFEESMPILEQMEEPFYAHMMTLTHHHPFILDEGEETIEPAETRSGTVNRYFQTARYLDEALEQFFEDLKEAGLYEDSIIMLYGDHYGISDNHNRAMEELLGEEITPLKYAELQRVPFIIRVPGVEGQGVNHSYSGMVDVMPTLLHILGIDARDYIVFGSDMFSEDHKDFVAFRRGDFMTEDYSKVNDVYYDNHTKEVIEEPTEEMLETDEKVHRELELSDKVLNGDLLRYYQPNEDWEPIDPNDYDYNYDMDTVEEVLEGAD
jgi:lipoteichoic acid synthase